MIRLCVATIAVVMACGSAFAQGRLPSPALNSPTITGGTISGSNASAAIVTPTGGNTALSMSLWQSFSQMTPGYGATIGGNNTAAINAANAAVLARGGGVVHIPGSYAGTFTYSYPDPNIVQEFDGPNINRSMLGFGGAATDSGKVFSGVLGTARPSGNNRSLLSSWAWSQGSGDNEASRADFAIHGYEKKINYSCTTARQAAALCPTVALQGENDVLSLTLLQGGPDATASPTLKSTGGLIVGGITCMDGTGACLASETHTTILDALTLANIKEIDVQTGGIQTRAGEKVAYGVLYNSNIGDMDAAIFVQANDTSSWGNVLQNNYQGTQNFTIKDNGAIVWGNPGSPVHEVAISNTGSLTGRVASGNMSFLNGNSVMLGSINADGTGGFSTGLTDTTPTAWVTGTAYAYGQVVTNGGNVYRNALMVGATSSVAPTHTSGCVAGADTLNWCFIATRADATLASFSGTGLIVTAPLSIQTAAASPVNVPVMAVTGNPNGQVSSPSGGLALRAVGGGIGRTAYLNEGTGVSTSWNSVVTASSAASLTATGTTISNALLLTSRWNIFTTVASGTGAQLGGNLFPDEQIVINRGANSINVYPPTSGQIDALGVGVAATVAAASVHGYYCTNNTQCYTVR